MAASLENIASEALSLPQDQRLTLANRILASLEPAPEADADVAWDEEIRARIKKYDAGNAPTHSGPAVFEELDKKLRG